MCPLISTRQIEGAQLGAGGYPPLNRKVRVRIRFATLGVWAKVAVSAVRESSEIRAEWRDLGPTVCPCSFCGVVLVASTPSGG